MSSKNIFEFDKNCVSCYLLKKNGKRINASKQNYDLFKLGLMHKAVWFPNIFCIRRATAEALFS